MSLSKRQREVVILVADGLSNKEIAERMRISTAGVKKHIEAAMHRYGVTRRTALVRAAIENGDLGLRTRPSQ